jgi:hypothetical protein
MGNAIIGPRTVMIHLRDTSKSIRDCGHAMTNMECPPFASLAMMRSWRLRGFTSSAPSCSTGGFIDFRLFAPRTSLSWLPIRRDTARIGLAGSNVRDPYAQHEGVEPQGLLEVKWFRLNGKEQEL